MKMYCSECGASIEYSSKKPNFCMNCGYSFSNASASTVQGEALEQENQDEDQVNPEIYGSMRELEYESDGGQAAKSFKMSDLMGTLSEDQKTEPPKRKRVNKRKVLEQWKKEAGAKPRKRGRPKKNK